jgi:flavin-dependent dehydrogenase
VGPQLFTVRTIDLNVTAERFYQRHYINMDREKFDRYLLSLIPPGVEIRDGCTARSFEEESAGVKIRFLSLGREFTEQARFLVGADGACSAVRHRLFKPDPSLQEYVAVQEWIPREKAPPYFSVVFDDEITDFYSWTIPKEEFLLLGSALPPRREALQKFTLLKQKLSSYGIVSSEEKYVKRNGSMLLRPRSANCFRCGKGKILLVGEAAGFISPTSAEGLSFAFKSALALSRSATEPDDGLPGRYRKKTASLRKNLFLKILKVPFMYDRLIRKLIMRSGITSMEIYRPD